jgi:hypothetical protein
MLGKNWKKSLIQGIATIAVLPGCSPSQNIVVGRTPVVVIVGTCVLDWDDEDWRVSEERSGPR